MASAFMNNTPLVAVMIPVVIQLAIKIGTAPSKLLIPLSYMTVLGGMITLIGTSTNILVDGVAVKQGLEHFSLFEIAPLGIAVTLAGGLFLALFGNRLLPERQSMGVLSERPAEDEVLHRGRGARGQHSDRAGGAGRGHLQARRCSGDRRLAWRCKPAARPCRGERLQAGTGWFCAPRWPS